jgi:hypothetical protein
MMGDGPCCVISSRLGGSMIPIEQTSMGMVVFLECGCAAVKWITHPTGLAALVRVLQRCETHHRDTEEIRSVRRGTPVNPYARTSIDPHWRQHRDSH